MAKRKPKIKVPVMKAAFFVAIATAIFFSGGHPPRALAFTNTPCQFTGVNTLSGGQNVISLSADDQACLTSHGWNSGYGIYWVGSNSLSSPLSSDWSWSTGMNGDFQINDVLINTVTGLNITGSPVYLYIQAGYNGYSFAADPAGTGYGNDPWGYFTLIPDGSAGYTVLAPSSESYLTYAGPTPNANTDSTTVSFGVDYYSNSTCSISSQTCHATKIEARFTRLDVSEPAQSKFYTITPDTAENITDAITLSSGGRYSLGWAMEDADGNYILIADPQQFGVISASDLPPLIPPQPTVTSCVNPFVDDITTAFFNPNFSALDCIKAAATWMFIPTSDSITQFKSISLTHTFPFSYLYDTVHVYDELFSNSGSMDYSVSVNTGTLGTISFISASQISAVPYASTIKTLLGYLLYFYTGMFLYRLILRAHD